MAGQVVVKNFFELKPKPRSSYGNRFMQLSQDGVAELSGRLADHTLGMQAVRVLLAMIEELDWQNRCEAPQKELAFKLGMSAQDVSKASTALVETGFIERMANRRGWYRVSPKLCWKGDIKDQRAALGLSRKASAAA